MLSWIQQLYYNLIDGPCEHELRYLKGEIEHDPMKKQLKSKDWYVCKKCGKEKTQETVQDYFDY